MKKIRYFLSLILLLLFSAPVFAQRYYRPWPSYKPVKPQKPYEIIDTFSDEFQQIKCKYYNNEYEPNEILTKLDINKEETFRFFKQCCAKHPSKCICEYIGTNNKTLLYTAVEQKAYRYIYWLLNDGFYYDSYIDQWGIFRNIDGLMTPLRNYNPMMLACKRGDLEAVKLLRQRGAYLSKPENAIGLTPYDFVKKDAQNKSKEFLDYIEQEYLEETKNISNNKEYGTYFSLNILQDFLNSFEENFLKNQKRIIEKVNQINKA